MDVIAVLGWGLMDALLIYITITEWSNLDGYAFLLVGCIAFFTWEVFRHIKHWFS